MKHLSPFAVYPSWAKRMKTRVASQFEPATLHRGHFPLIIARTTLAAPDQPPPGDDAFQ